MSQEVVAQAPRPNMLFALPLGNACTKFGIVLDGAVPPGFDHAPWRQQERGYPPEVRGMWQEGSVRHLPSYVLLAPEGTEPPVLSDTDREALHALAQEERGGRAIAASGKTGQPYARLRQLFNARHNMGVIGRAVVLGVLPLPDRTPTVTLTGQQVTSLARGAIGVEIDSARPTALCGELVRKMGTRGSSPATLRAFAVGALIGGPAFRYAQYDAKRLQANPHVLSAPLHSALPE